MWTFRPVFLFAAGLALLMGTGLAAQELKDAVKNPPADAAKDAKAETPTDAANEASDDTPKDAAPKDAPPDKKEDPGQTLFQQGRDALFQGEYTRAIELLGKAVAADTSKTKTSYRLYLARAYGYAGRSKEAEPLLKAILKVAPDHVEAGRLLAEIYASDEAWQKIVDLMEPLLKYRHDYPTYHLLAEASYNLDRYEKARKYYQEAIKLNPDSAGDRYQLGNICLAGNLFTLAVESYEAALRLGVESPVLHYKLASAYFNQRNYFGRISTVTVRTGAAGTISDKWYLIEPVAGKKDQFHAAPSKSAIYHVAKAIEGGLKDRPDIHVLQANIYLNARRYRQAFEMFGRIAPTVPKEDEALFYYNYAQSAFGVGDYEKYLELLGEAIKRDKQAYGATLVDAYVRVAQQYNQSGRLDKYIEYLAKAVAESPRTASLHLKLGYAYEEARRYAEAIVQWQMVLDLEPDHPQRTGLLNLIDKHRAA